jgi:hypothetical protein
LNFAASSKLQGTSERKNLWKPEVEQLDKVFYSWLVLKCSSRVAILGLILISLAVDFKEQMGITEDCTFLCNMGFGSLTFVEISNLLCRLLLVSVS